MSPLAIIGFIAFVVLIIALLKAPIPPWAAFVAIPVVAALIAGISLSEIGNLAKSGWASVQVAIVVTCFAIIYFSIMNDVGLFEVITTPLVKRVTHAKNPIYALCLTATLIASISHLDGQGNTTIMITLPLMVPLFDQLKMDRRSLALSMGIAVGAMNLLPWTGPTRYTAVALGMDPAEFWRYIIPAQLIMLGVGFLVARLVGKYEMKNGALNQKLTSEVEIKESTSLCVVNKKYFIFNLCLTMVTILILVGSFLNSAVTFMLATAIALIVNYKDKKTVAKKIRDFSGSALPMTLNVIGIGVLIGIMTEGGFINAMAESLMALMPKSVGPFVYIIIAILAMPLLMMLGTGPYYQGLVPVILALAVSYGVNPIIAAAVMLVPTGVSVCVSPMISANHISSGMLGFSIGDFIKYAWKWVLVVSWIAIPVVYFTVSLLVKLF